MIHGILPLLENLRDPYTDISRIIPSLAAAGGTLLRGCCNTPQAFEKITRHLVANFHHVGIRQRLRQDEGDGLTTRAFADNFILLGHSEGTYRPYPPPPELCFFMCLQAPACAGGETTLVDGVAMLQQMAPELRERFTNGLIYETVWEQPRWQVEFGVTTAAELSASLESIPGCRFSLEDSILHLHIPAPAIRRALNGEEAFANGLLTHLPIVNHPRYRHLPVYAKSTNRVYLMDGEEIGGALLNELIDLHDHLLVKHRWHNGDVLILDNFRFMHGRVMTEEACPRTLISRFGSLKQTLRPGTSP